MCEQNLSHYNGNSYFDVDVVASEFGAVESVDGDLGLPLISHVLQTHTHTHPFNGPFPGLPK